MGCLCIHMAPVDWDAGGCAGGYQSYIFQKYGQALTRRYVEGSEGSVVSAQAVDGSQTAHWEGADPLSAVSGAERGRSDGSRNRSAPHLYRQKDVDRYLPLGWCHDPGMKWISSEGHLFHIKQSVDPQTEKHSRPKEKYFSFYQVKQDITGREWSTEKGQTKEDKTWKALSQESTVLLMLRRNSPQPMFLDGITEGIPKRISPKGRRRKEEIP